MTTHCHASFISLRVCSSEESYSANNRLQYLKDEGHKPILRTIVGTQRKVYNVARSSISILDCYA